MTGLSHGGHYSAPGRTAKVNFMKQQMKEHEKRHPLPEKPFSEESNRREKG